MNKQAEASLAVQFLIRVNSHLFSSVSPFRRLIMESWTPPLPCLIPMGTLLSIAAFPLEAESYPAKREGGSARAHFS